jgi:uroporphyrinogen-III synthase
VIGAFGNNTSKAIEEAGLTLGIKAPEPQSPSMVAALEKFLLSELKKK